MDDVFLAQLVGVHGKDVSGKEEEAEIPINEVSEEDRDLLEPGAFFRLCISYDAPPRGPIRRGAHVVFRRLPAYRSEDLEEAERRGAEIASNLRLE